MELSDTLNERYLQLSTKIGLSNSELNFNKLIEKYSSKDRFYHNLSMLKKNLDLFDSFGVQDTNRPLEVELALWYKDYSTNKKNSADFVISFFNQSEYSRSAISPQIVYGLIKSANHDSLIQDIDSQLVADIDLSYLGQSIDSFIQDESAIALEYPSNENLDLSRGNLFKKLIERPFIFQTEYFKIKFEAKARENALFAIKDLYFS